MRLGMKTATATVALLAATTFALAQAQDDKGKGPAEGKPPAAAQPQAGDKAQPRAAQPEQKMEGQKGAQERTTDRPKSTEGPQRDTDRQKSAQPQERTPDTTKRTENPDQDKQQRQKTGQQPGKEPQRSAEPQQRDMDKDKQKSTRSKDEPARDQNKTAQQPKEPAQGERLKVSEQERTRVRDRIRQTRVEKTRINVNISVGTHIPRSVRLHTLPVAIVEFAPEYRGYSYIVLEDDTIVIVHPTTYVIVDYIPASSQRAGIQQHLVLSSDQMRFVYRTLEREPRAGIRARLALGAEVPRDVELVVFPGEVLQRVPELERYRYIMSDDGVLVVNPASHEVVLVINE